MRERRGAGQPKQRDENVAAAQRVNRGARRDDATSPSNGSQHLMPADMMAATDRQPLPDEDDVFHFDPSLDDKLWHTSAFTSLAPSGRRSVNRLTEWLDWAIKHKIDTKNQSPMDVVKGVQLMYSVCFRELIRQISVQCSERGLLLAKVWWKYVQLFKRVLEHSEEEKVRVIDVLEEKHAEKMKQLEVEYENNIKSSHENFLQKLEILGENKEELAQRLQNLQRELIRRQNELEIYNRKHVYLQKDLYNLKLRVKRSEERCAEFETCRSFLLQGTESSELPLALKKDLCARDRLSAITLLVSDVQDRISSLPFGVKDGIFKTLMKEVRLHFEREVPTALKDEFRGQRFDSLLGLEGMLLAMEKHLTSEEQWLLKQIKDTGVIIEDPESGLSVADLGPEDLSLELSEEEIRRRKHTLIQESTTDTVDVHQHMEEVEAAVGTDPVAQKDAEENWTAAMGTAPPAQGTTDTLSAKADAARKMGNAKEKSQAVIGDMAGSQPQKGGEDATATAEGETGDAETEAPAVDPDAANAAETVSRALDEDRNGGRQANTAPPSGEGDARAPGTESGDAETGKGAEEGGTSTPQVTVTTTEDSPDGDKPDGGEKADGKPATSSSKSLEPTTDRPSPASGLGDEEEYVVLEDKSTQTDFSRDEYYPPIKEPSAGIISLPGSSDVSPLVSRAGDKKSRKGSKRKETKTRAAIEEENRQNRIKAKSKRKKKQVTIYNRQFARILGKVNTDISSFRTRSRKIILKLIGQIYAEKITSDGVDDTSGAQRTTMPEFVYTYHLFKYGLRQLAEKFLADFLLNILAAMGRNQRVSSFASFCGIGDPAGPDALDLYLYAISCLKNALGSTFLDTEDEEWLIPASTASETARFIFHYYDDDAMAMLLAKVSKLSLETTPGKVDGDEFLACLVKEWTSKGEDAPGGLVALFTAADYDADGFLNFEEFRSLVEHVSKDRTPMEIARMYRESLDRTDANEDGDGTADGIALDAFLVVARERGLASWKAQAAMPAKPGINSQQMFELLESTWETTQSWVEEQLKVLGSDDSKLPPEISQRLNSKRAAFIQLLRNRSEVNAAWHSYRMLMEDIHAAVKDYYSVAPGKGFLPEGYSKLF